MSQGRNPTNDSPSSKDNELPHSNDPLVLESLESNDTQTLISFSGRDVDGAVLAVSDPDVSHDQAMRIVQDAAAAIGGEL